MDIVFLASWYPSLLSPDLGNFVHRHAKAVAKVGVRLKVIHVAFSNRVLFSKIEHERVNQIEVYHLFLPRVASKSDFVRRYWTKKLVKKLSANGFDPQLIHCHVAYPAGDFAIELSENLNIPLVYTEHWSRFDQADFNEPIQEMEEQIRRVASKSAAILPVSDYLSKIMQERGIKGNYEVIGNCVNTKYFYPRTEKKPKEFTFLHISNFEPGIKNTEGILKAFSRLSQEGVRLIIGGDGDLKRLKHFCESENIDTRNIRFHEKLTYPEVAKLNQESDCFVLFSVTENLPCVIAEALCCGNPVISTDVGGVSEMISAQNGLLVHGQTITELTNVMEKLRKDYNCFNKLQIGENAAKCYSYESIGNAFLTVYQSVLDNIKVKNS